MTRKSVTTYAGGKGPRQFIWEGIRKLDALGNVAWTEDDLWRQLPREARPSVSDSTIRDYRRALIAAGILAIVEEPTPRQQGRYRLVKNEGLDAPRVRKDGTRVTMGLPQEQMWRTLRLLKGDTNARELAAHASTIDIPVALVAANDYLRKLATAGYLITTAEGRGTGTRGQLARYKLKPNRNTGPRPPMVCRTKAVYDANEGRIVWQARLSEEDAIYG